jgi:pimeloyl-ACP methyl ester carboxylesterase
MPSSAIVAVFVAAAAGVYALLRLMPQLSYSELLKSEALLLSTVRQDVRHHWSAFATRHANWRIHALWLRSPSAVVQEDAGGGRKLPGAATVAAGRLPVVLLHGHSTSAAHWECVIDRLGALADVFIIDLPGAFRSGRLLTGSRHAFATWFACTAGWGRSPAPPALEQSVDPTVTGDLHIELIEGWLKANDLDKVTLIGEAFRTVCLHVGFYPVQLFVNHRHFQ